MSQTVQISNELRLVPESKDAECQTTPRIEIAKRAARITPKLQSTGVASAVPDAAAVSSAMQTRTISLCNSAVKERFAPLKTFFGQATRTIRRNPAAPEPCAPLPEPVPAPHLSLLVPLPRLGPPTDVSFASSVSSLPQFVFYTDCESRKLRAAAKRFTPEAIAGTRRERLLSGWTCACEIALGALLDITGGESIDFAPGFVFSDEAKAVCVSSDGIHSLLLRPVDGDGRSAYSVSAPSTAYLLLAAAAHEAVHVIHSCHNEDFAATLTELFGKVSAHAKLVRAALRRPQSAENSVENTFSDAA
ncbi:MAG: hypothetical protein ACOYM3_16480 [Terrimicrobiaceae bacterium]